MAVVQGPLHSDTAKGKFDNVITFKGVRTTQIAQIYSIPKNPKTEDQTLVRNYFTLGVKGWQAATSTVKSAWNTYAVSDGGKMSGYNEFLKAWMDYGKTVLYNPHELPTGRTPPPPMT